ncbi:MAG: class I SAM-dependent methyltransferase [Candidatus Omnitrophota bacterium]|nr:class I SAM-dependent methyltransferase [Candidatus Omnitrophota bacterium]
MSIGTSVRQMLGPLERPVSKAYRAIFVDLLAFVKKIKNWVPEQSILEILEVGCGEGLLTELLAKEYCNSRVSGIDISPRVGRLFRGDANRVFFRQIEIQSFVRESHSNFDLVVIADVLHHIPLKMRKESLGYVREIMKPGALLVVKDWERTPMPIHALAYFSDRYITGDRVYYYTASELRNLIKDVFGKNAVKDEAWIHPWFNNVAFFIQI